MENILRVEKIEKYYGNKDNVTKANDNIITGKIMILLG